jgi:hypothetical protein
MSGASASHLTDMAADRDRWRRCAQAQRADVRAAVEMVQLTTGLLEMLTEREERRPHMRADTLHRLRAGLTAELADASLIVAAVRESLMVEAAEREIPTSDLDGLGAAVDAELAAAEALAEFEAWVALGGDRP